MSGSTTSAERQERRHAETAPVATPKLVAEVDSADQRQPFEIDRDRILYCSAFRRLAGVTQVVNSAEGHIFHNRLTHSMKAAQIGRRLTQRIINEWRSDAEILALDPEVVEAAALGHDLGHPPFGHVGEAALNEAVCKAMHGPADGFEGNAQTFRILTKLASRRSAYLGLNLTRATLRAIVKYPWHKDQGSNPQKWNAYLSEADDFAFALQHHTDKSPEAQLMEWADDIAYSVHDLDDFYRAGLLPLDRLAQDQEERSDFVQKASARWTKLGLKPADALFALKILEMAPGELSRPYYGGRGQRAELRLFTSRLIGRYVKSVRVTQSESGPRLHFPDDLHAEVTVLKELMRHYVFCDPALAAQQYGHRRVVTELFEAFADAAHCTGAASRSILPVSLREFLEDEEQRYGGACDTLRTRIAADTIANMTEQQATAIHRRLRGIDPGTIYDAITG